MQMVNLALQGGGSHGAFTWGVLDALLEDGRLGFEGLSGTSAGAVNAVALASGWARAQAHGRDPREGAREKLAGIWHRVGALGSLGTLQQQFTRMLWGGLPPELSPGNLIGNAWRGVLSPYQVNPLDINPLRKMLEEEIDFEAMAAQRELKVFVSATHVNTGKAVVFTGRQLDARAVLASACLPMLFQAVEIDGEAYWDGGYAGNPTITPLVRHCDSADTILVQINPIERPGTPRTAAEIHNRLNEISFNSPLMKELRMAALLRRTSDPGTGEGALWARMRIHRIASAMMTDLGASSKLLAEWRFLCMLRDEGRRATDLFLAAHAADVGVRSSYDIDELLEGV
jgi:NTE family protein